MSYFRLKTQNIKNLLLSIIKTSLNDRWTLLALFRWREAEVNLSRKFNPRLVVYSSNIYV